MATVAVLGGGYGGIAVAKALDDVADVVLIEPREHFVHTVAALRGLVDPQWTDRLFFPYERLLTRGRVVRDAAAAVEPGRVTLASGERIEADYLVLATGSSYPFPAKIDVLDTAAAKAKLHSTRGVLEQADGVLLLGAGPAGLELAGEIRAAWPDKAITIVDPADDILSGRYPGELRDELRRQLSAMRVELLLGTTLAAPPPSEPGEAKTFTAITESGSQVTADIWFRCYGIVPSSDYLVGDLAAARQANGHVEVTGHLRLPGQDRVFAIGDLTALPETKMAKAAADHADLVAANIRALEAGEPLRTYTPAAPAIALPLGPSGGASYVDSMGVLGAERTAQIKGADLRIGSYAALFGH
ncbi:MAG TPA: FAD-dependent oxidoreductase [Amycolatopsis sp.]|nr:FAD-dependent oxidoreductase [Amycolatopsis sp.]